MPHDDAGNPPAPSPQDLHIIEDLRRGDEMAFSNLVDRYYGPLLRLAMAYVPSRAVAEEVVQETWLGVIEGISRFEGRSSLKTWIFKILVNRAKTRGKRESRYETGSGNPNDPDQDDNPILDQFVSSGPQQNHWKTPPQSWDADTPERLLLSKESRQQIDKAIEALPPTQRQVITLRDIEGLPSVEICNILGISETNQRVLLHRARGKVRKMLETFVHGQSFAP